METPGTKYIIGYYNVIRPLYNDYKFHHICYRNYYEVHIVHYIKSRLSWHSFRFHHGLHPSHIPSTSLVIIDLGIFPHSSSNAWPNSSRVAARCFIEVERIWNSI